MHRFELISADGDEATFEADCGKGAYVRALARDLGRTLGCFGHVISLRRTRVGPFFADAGVAPDALEDAAVRASALLPVVAGLNEMTMIPIDRTGAAVLRRGGKLLLRGSHAPLDGQVYAACFGTPVAVGLIEAGHFVSTRVFNLP